MKRGKRKFHNIKKSSFLKDNKLLLIILLIASVPVISVLSAFSILAIPSRFGTVDYTWISISAGDFNDISTDDGQGRFFTSTGGAQLISFTNEGYFGMVEQNGTIFYRASAVFRVGVNAFTLADIYDMFPNMEVDTIKTSEYVEIYKYPSENIYPPPEYNNLEIITACANYRTIDFDSTIENAEGQPFTGIAFNEHDYWGSLPLTVSVQQDFGAFSDIQVSEGLTFSNPSLASEIKKVVVSTTREDVVGDYEDLYLGGSESFGAVSLDFPEVTNPSIGSGDRKELATQEIADLNLGCKFLDLEEELTVTPPGKTGQSFLAAEPVGVDWDNIQSTSSFTFNVPMRIKPEVTYARQDVETRWARLLWDYEDAIFSYAGVWVDSGPISQVSQRYPSVHVTNRYIHQEYDVEVNFIATMAFDPELGGHLLEDPFVMSGDFIWDESLFGTSDYTITQYTPVQDFIDNFITSFLPMIIIILVSIVGLYIFIKIGIPLIRYNIKKKDRKLN